MLAVFLISLFVPLFLGVPIAFSLVISGVAMMSASGVFDTQIIANNLINGANNFALMAIPFFILAGEIMNKGGISKRIVGFAMALVGHIRGGLGYVAIIAAVMFAGLSGSAVADTAALGAILIPMMISRGYNINYSTGLVASAGIIAPVIPPSIGMIVYGVTGGVSITKLFIGGIVPGLIMGLGLITMWMLISRNDNSELPEHKSFKEIWYATRQAAWALFLPILIVVGLRGGVFTPTEAGVIAVFYALFIGMFVYKELKVPDMYQVFIDAAKTTSVVMFIVGASSVVAWMITVAHIPAEMANSLSGILHNHIALLLSIVVFLLITGLVMDMTPALLILVPVLLPIIKQAGIDPIYFGILMIICLSVGLITPPVGTVLYVGMGLAKISIFDITKGVLPFVLVYLLAIILFILFPSIVTVPIGWFV
ncbi:MAG: TRAP transporter large permease subunit [Dehalobacterium sp.]